MRVLEPLQPVITADGALKCGVVEIDEQTFRVECAMDDSWVCLYDDSLGDPMSYDVLTRGPDGALQSEQPTLTIEWTPEHFAWLQDFMDPPPQEPQPEPMLFIRRPAQGFAPPQTSETPAEPSQEILLFPETQMDERLRRFLIGVLYLFLGTLCWKSGFILLELMGAFCLLKTMCLFYMSRTLATDIFTMIGAAFKQRL